MKEFIFMERNGIHIIDLKKTQNKIEEAYEAVSWSTVFLLASLIPLGLAVETSEG